MCFMSIVMKSYWRSNTYCKIVFGISALFVVTSINNQKHQKYLNVFSLLLIFSSTIVAHLIFEHFLQKQSIYYWAKVTYIVNTSKHILGKLPRQIVSSARFETCSPWNVSKIETVASLPSMGLKIALKETSGVVISLRLYLLCSVPSVYLISFLTLSFISMAPSGWGRWTP